MKNMDNAMLKSVLAALAKGQHIEAVDDAAFQALIVIERLEAKLEIMERLLNERD